MIINNVHSFEPMFGTLRVTPHPILRGTLKSQYSSFQPSDRGKVPCIVYGVPKYAFKPPPQPKIAISLFSA